MRNLINNFLPPFSWEKERKRESETEKNSRKLMHAYLFKHILNTKSTRNKIVYRCLSINDVDNITSMHLLLRKHRYLWESLEILTFNGYRSTKSFLLSRSRMETVKEHLRARRSVPILRNETAGNVSLRSTRVRIARSTMKHWAPQDSGDSWLSLAVK